MAFFGLLAIYLTPTEGKTLTLATDGEYMYYNPVWVEKVFKEEGIDAVMGAVAHEVMHCALQHLWRRKGRDPLMWNVACDYAVNAILRQSGLVLPQGGLYDKAFEGMTAEEIYQKLKKDQQLVMLQAWDSHERWGEKGIGDNPGAPGQENEEGGAGSRGQGKDDQAQGPKGASPESTWREPEETWKGRLAEVYQRARSHGFAPAGLERMVEEALKPDIPWEAILVDFMQKIHHEYNWLPPDRRLIWDDIYIPSLSDGETIPEGVIAIDSSGSISDRLLQKFLANTRSAAQHISKLHVVVCDARVWLFKTIDMTEGNSFPPIKIRGGGGTDFRPVFEEIKKRGVRPQFLVYLTDGYGTYPDNPPDYPVLWLSTGDKPPWGQYVAIPED